MSGVNYKMKIKPTLLGKDKVSYASDHIELPEGGVDCFEGCNPYGFPKSVYETVRNFDIARLGPYPHSTAFFDAIREYWEGIVDIEKGNVLFADGSINAIYSINNIFDADDSKVLGICPQFTDYYENALMQGIEYDPMFLRKENNYKFDVKEFLDRIDERYNYVYLDNPNNPTGQNVPLEDIVRIVEKAAEYGIIVIVDEAYGEFMDKKDSAVNIFNSYENLIVIKTMSKGFGLAGLRCGYILSNKTFIKYMNKMNNPYNISELGREIAAAALRNSGEIEEHKAAFARMKEQIAKVVGKNLHIAETLPTCSLILLYADDESVKVKEELYKRGALVVDGNDFKGLDSSSARVRLPKEEDFPKLLAAIEDLEHSLDA